MAGRYARYIEAPGGSVCGNAASCMAVALVVALLLPLLGLMLSRHGTSTVIDVTTPPLHVNSSCCFPPGVININNSPAGIVPTAVQYVEGL